MKQTSKQAEDHWNSIYEEIKGRGARSNGDYTVVPGTSRGQVKEDLMERKEERLARTCEWKYDENDFFWEAKCGFAFMLTDGTLEENKIKYCPGCGGKIGLSAYEPEEGDFYWTEETFNSVKESLESGFVWAPEWALEDDESFFKWINSVEDE